MKSYSKGKLNFRRVSIVFLIIILLIIIAFISLFFYVKHKNYFKYEKVDDSAIHVSDDVAKNSFPIVVNNVVIGATYNKKWVSAVRYNNNSLNKVGKELDLFSFDGKYGTFKITDIKNVKGNSIVSTEKINNIYEYYGVKKDSINFNVKVYNVNSEEKYINFAKKALLKYKFFNDSIKVTNVYSTTLNNKDNAYIITVTSDRKVNNFGAYSAVLYADDFGNTKIIKYNFVANPKDSEKFNVYDVKFISDLNGDGFNDIILCELNEFETKYSVVEMRNNNFFEVLSCKIN